MSATTAKPTASDGPWKSITEIVSETRAVYHETGLTPRQLAHLWTTEKENVATLVESCEQLADQRAELLAVLEGFVESAEIDCYCDELILMAKPCCACKAKAAIARAKAVPK